MVYSTSLNRVKDANQNNGKIINVLIRVVKILDKFKGNYEKRFNFTKLSQLLKLNSKDVDEIIGLILNFQDLFSTTFNEYNIKKEIKDNQIFLITETKKINNYIPVKIKLSLENHNLLSDIVYMFKFVKRGKGFDIKTNGAELLGNIKEFWNYHPYFFEEHENGLMYPSEFGLKLGELLLSYKKSGKKIESLQLDNHSIQVENNKRK